MKLLLVVLSLSFAHSASAMYYCNYDGSSNVTCHFDKVASGASCVLKAYAPGVSAPSVVTSSSSASWSSSSLSTSGSFNFSGSVSALPCGVNYTVYGVCPEATEFFPSGYANAVVAPVKRACPSTGGSVVTGFSSGSSVLRAAPAPAVRVAPMVRPVAP